MMHFCTLHLEAEQGTNSYDVGDSATASGLPYATTAGHEKLKRSLVELIHLAAALIIFRKVPAETAMISGQVPKARKDVASWWKKLIL